MENSEILDDVFDPAASPALNWHNDCWTGELQLQFWRGFRLPANGLNRVDRERESNGTIQLVVEVPDDEPHPISAAQRVAVQNLIRGEQHISQTVLAAIFDKYPDERRAYGFAGSQDDGEYDDDESQEVMPQIDQPEDLKKLIGLTRIYILHRERDNVPLVGFEFGCTWDESHGLGVMTHRGRAVYIGDGEAARTAWIAERRGNWS